MLLAGDVGGTKTLVGVFEPGTARPVLVQAREFPTLEFSGLQDIVRAFLDTLDNRTPSIEAGGFGVAGPVVENTARLVNVPWLVNGDDVAAAFRIPRVGLVNDLAAMAYAVPALRRDELAVLQEGRPVATGNAALIAAGTGLGEALLHNVEGRFVPSPSEGGHADYAPRTKRELELTGFLMDRYTRVECERVISGPGLVNIHRFTHPGPCDQVDARADAPDLPARISSAGLEGRCPRCRETLEIFVGAYGAEAGNLALRSVATAGVYIGGGIAPKILPALQTGRFIQAFRAKEPLDPLLSAIPVSVILNQQAGLLGAAVYARMLL